MMIWHLPFRYPKINGASLITFASIDGISQALKTIDNETYCIIVFDNPDDEASEKLLKSVVDHPLVFPSVNLLDNQISQPSL